MQEEALQVVRMWGCVPKSEIVWEKVTKNGKPWFGMGRHVRAAHETAIVATRGRPKPLSSSVRSRFAAKVPLNPDGSYRHSGKPDVFFAMAEQLAAGPRLELFARKRRKGWTCRGLEAGGLK